jgi:cell division protease FtsH
MSDEAGVLTYDQPSSPFLPGVAAGSPQAYSEATARTIDAEVRAIVEQAHAQVRQILGEQKALLERLARRLLEQEVLEGDELRALLARPSVAAAAP